MTVWSCTTCDKTSESHLRCGQCQFARYCDVSCQRKDFSTHKDWCQAAAKARTCTHCMELADAFPSSLILHADCIKYKSTVDRPADMKVFVFHKPFVSKIAISLAELYHGDVDPEAAFDTIITLDGQVLYGIWEKDFTKTKLNLLRNKRNEACTVCHEIVGKEQKVSCRCCCSPVCKICIQRMGKGSSCGIAYCCPMCRARMLYVCEMEFVQVLAPQ